MSEEYLQAMSKQIKIREGLELDEHMIVILTEMCKRVNADFLHVILDQTKEINGRYHWPYDAYTWTQEQKEDFEKWAINYLYTSTDARRGLTHCHKNKKCLSNAVGLISFMWGWKYEEKEEKSPAESGRQP